MLFGDAKQHRAKGVSSLFIFVPDRDLAGVVLLFIHSVYDVEQLSHLHKLGLDAAHSRLDLLSIGCRGSTGQDSRQHKTEKRKRRIKKKKTLLSLGLAWSGSVGAGCCVFLELSSGPAKILGRYGYLGT